MTVPIGVETVRDRCKRPLGGRSYRASQSLILTDYGECRCEGSQEPHGMSSLGKLSRRKQCYSARRSED